MTKSSLRRSVFALVIGSLTIPLSACVEPGGYGYDDGVGVGVDYYEPYGAFYGGWGGGYQVGPYGDHGHRNEGARGGQSAHSYRSAPASRSVPSIPSRGGGGGSRR
jgi:hypothetical protein